MRRQGFGRWVGMAGLCCPLLAGAAEIGTVAATNPDIDATDPGGPRRTLVLGESLLENARIQTSAQGSGQFLFLDQTTLTVAPLSDFVIDKFVFDPNRDTGAIAMSMAKGSLRFIGGRVTKSDTAVVRTPTATVGIRGGMALILLDPNGATQAVHLAGQSTTVSSYGDGDGDGLDDGPAPGAALGAGVDTETLSRPNASALADATGVTFTGLFTAAQLAQAYAKLEGTGTGGTDAPPAEAEVETASAPVSAVNSEVPGIETQAPVSTTGESAADPTPPAPVVDVGQDDATIAEDPETLPDEEGEVDPGFATATAGAILLTDGAVAEFATVATGSLIGKTADGGVRFEVSVPETADDLTLSAQDLGFDLPASPNIRGGFVVLRDNVGTATLFTGDSENIARLSLIGFSDLTAGFHYLEYVRGDLGDDPTPGFFGFAVFGVPTPGQGAVLEQALSDGPEGANTLDTFRVQAGPLFGDLLASDPPEYAYLVGNADEATSGAAPVTRWLFADLSLGSDSAEQTTSLSVLAQQAQTGPGGAPVLNGTAYVQGREGGVTDVSFANLGTFADVDGNTMYGADGDYIVVSSVRPNGAGGAQVLDPGFGFAVDPTGTRFQTREDNDPVSVLLARDADASGLVEMPTPLAQANQGLGLARGESYATGIAQCGGGGCGRAPVAGGEVGSYVLTTGSHSDAGGAQLRFGSGNPDSNGLAGQLQLVANPMAVGASGGGAELVLNFGGEGDTGAYIDDARFAATGQFQGGSVFDQGGGNASSAVASAGLAGDGDLFAAGVDSHPEFLRWGWWAADYQVTAPGDSGTRDDVVHLGTWVAGDRPDIADLPPSGVASYDGFAVGTVATYGATQNGLGQTTDIRVIGGDFALSYDFAEGAGDFTLNLPDIGFRQTLAVFEGGDLGDYAGTRAAESESFRVEGSFFAGADSPIAATGGEFAITQPNPEREVTGVFGADLGRFDPQGSNGGP